MPCYDPPMSQEEINKERKAEQQRQLEEFTHNSPLAEIFCSTMKELEALGDCNRLNFQIIDRMPEAALKWWKDHQYRDNQKKIREAKQRQRVDEKERALLKLTPREKKLLGIK